jgi:hypothetical protein
MAKLPDINYLSTTPSLGRQDISLPSKMLTAQMGLIGAVEKGVVDFAQQMADQAMGESVAGAQSEMTQLKTVLVQQRVVDVDQYNLNPGVDYKAEDVNGEPIKSISSHTVMDKVWEDGVKTITDKYSEGMAPGQRRLMRSKLAGSIAKMGGMVNQQAHKWRGDEINAKADQQVHTLRNSATFEIKDEVKQQISSTINDLVRTGTMSAEEGVKKTRIERSKVDYHVTSQLLTEGGRTELDQVEEMLARPPAETGLELTLEQRKALYTQMDARENRLERNREKTEKLEGERFVTNTLIDIQENGAKPWNDIRQLVRNMPPASARLAVTLNQLKMKEDAVEDEEGDQTIYDGIETDILGATMATLGKDVSPQVMKDTLNNRIYDALVDHQQGRPGITADEANVLTNRVDGAMKQKMRPIGYTDAKEQLAGYITKGSVANLGTRNNGAQALKFYEALRDMNEAIRTGTTRDPLTWVEQNKDNYLGGTAVANMTKADVAIAERFSVPADVSNAGRPEGAPPFNTTESLAKVRAAYDAGTITPSTYQMTVDFFRDRRAAHMELLRRRAERENQ